MQDSDKNTVSFSERNNISPSKKIQRETMDEALRNGLWNVFCSTLLDSGLVNSKTVFSILWEDFFKRQNDVFRSMNPHIMRQQFKKDFFEMQWYEVYDLIEFVCKDGNSTLQPKANLHFIILNEWSFKDYNTKEFIDACNKILEQEISAYRIVGKNVVETTSKTEIKEIEKAQQSPIESVNEHLVRALELLSDRDRPDYRNSIKESISAVESVCKKIVNNDTDTLGQALAKMGKINMFDFHPSMISAFDKLYGYTSADTGIRHSLQGNERHIPFEEAMFFLTICSAFVNYLVALSSKHEINLE